MKKIIFLIAFIAISATSIGQVFPISPVPQHTAFSRGTYGTIQPYGYLAGNICSIITNTVTPVAVGSFDTLKNVDTGFVQFALNNSYDLLFDLQYNNLTGTAGGTAILQGSIDNASWHTLTGNTTYCSGCAGASGTVSGTGTTHYQWYLPQDATSYPYYQIRTIQSGTCTATYTGTVGYKY